MILIPHKFSFRSDPLHKQIFTDPVRHQFYEFMDFKVALLRIHTQNSTHWRSNLSHCVIQKAYFNNAEKKL